MMEFTEKELFCLARHLIAQHYEEKYPLTYISLYNDGVERYKRRKEHEKMTTEEIEKAKSSEEQKEKQKQILYIKSDIQKIQGTGLQSKHVVKFYKKKLVELGVMKHLKNAYAKTTNVKLKGKNHEKLAKRG